MLLAVQKVMDRGESQFIEDCYLPADISDGQEEDNDIKDEEGMSSEPEVCVFLQGRYLITHMGTAENPEKFRRMSEGKKVFCLSPSGSQRSPEKRVRNSAAWQTSTYVLLICVFNLSLPQILTDKTTIKRFSRSSENINSEVSFRHVSMLQIF